MYLKRSSSLCVVVLLGLFVAAQAQIPCGPTIRPLPTLSVNWSQYRFDTAHSGCNPYERLLSTGTVGQLVVDWQYQSLDGMEASPTVVNGVVYLDRYVLNADTGAQEGRPDVMQTFENSLEDKIYDAAAPKPHVFRISPSDTQPVKSTR